MNNTLYANNESKRCAAYCKKHSCHMTVKQIKNRQCLKKQCYYLEKDLTYPYWHQREVMKQRRKERKARYQ